MDRLGKLLFPHNPKMVRYRKVQLLFIITLCVLLCCAGVGAIVYFLGRPGY